MHIHKPLVNPDGKTHANASFLRTAMAMVPIEVWLTGMETPVITYTFLDSGSSSTFCTEALMRQLGTNGTKTTISLTTLEKKGSLAIFDLDENAFVDLQTIFTRPSIPLSCKNIPTQDDVDKWLNL